MGIINVLDKQTANLIAAGEVVERPASAVKEMLENCADALSSNVTVEIKDGGTTFIRITDDGCGIMREDVPKTILRHATSKIRTGADLEAIGTLGFRGEALAAIAAVSKLRILTKHKSEEIGSSFECAFGEAQEVIDAGCPDGTTIIVENIFENTPARRKFLKKNTTEAIAVQAVCEKFALSRPNIALKFISDGNIKLQTPGDGVLKNAVYASIGREFAVNLLEVDYEYAKMRVYGFIGKPEICRPNRNMQNFFVNGRFIKSRTLMAALEEGFRGFCPVGKFPACVLFIETDLKLVDVNIHPAKLEIKFSDERIIFDTVYFAVKNALARTASSVFSFGAEKELKNEEIPVKTEETVSQIPQKRADFTVKKENYFDVPSESAEIPKKTDFPPETVPIIEDNAEKSTKPSQTVEKVEVHEQQEIIKKELLERPIYVGEVFDTYLIVQYHESMYLIDKHAAHERIIYEKIKHASDNNESQFLLEPVALTLTPKEFEAACQNVSYFKKIGFDFEEFGSDALLIRSMPSILDISDVKDVFTFLAGSLAEGNNKSSGEIFDRALFTAACKAAIKGGNKHTDLDNLFIINEIFTNDAVLYCPHGRPVITEFSRSKLEKIFGR